MSMYGPEKKTYEKLSLVANDLLAQCAHTSGQKYDSFQLCARGTKSRTFVHETSGRNVIGVILKPKNSIEKKNRSRRSKKPTTKKGKINKNYKNMVKQIKSTQHEIHP